MLDLIVKERGSLAAVGCASYASQIQSQAHFTVICSGAFSPADTAPLTPGSSRFALSARRHYRDLAELGKGLFSRKCPMAVRLDDKELLQKINDAMESNGFDETKQDEFMKKAISILPQAELQ